MTYTAENHAIGTKWVDEENGLVSREIFGSEPVHRLENERIFRKAWLYLAHESEIPLPGDVVTRTMAGDPVVVVRREDGTVAAHVNSCRHRGVMVCRVDSGNTRRFTCPYHGWTYDTNGALLSTGFDALYPEGTDFGRLGLIPVPRLAVYKGLIFGSWSASAEPLEEYLGDFAWYLDLFFARTPGGVEVLGPPQRFIVNTDWKTAAINFGTDNTHVLTTHVGPLTLGKRWPISRAELMKGLQDAVQVSTGNGHSCSLVAIPGEPFAHYPKELRELFEKTLTQDQARVLGELGIAVSTVFPNFSFIENLAQETEFGTFVKGLTVRQWQPVAPGRIEVLSWAFADREAPAEYKAAAYARGVNDFGVGGVFEQDDVELWSSVGRLAASPAVRDHPFVLATALPMLNQPMSGHPGPGQAYQPFAAEITQFKFLQHWNRMMTERGE